MHDITGMLETHPRGSQVDIDVYAVTIQELSHCDLTCTVCADACLSELHVQMLARCIALNLACADSCATTARVVGRIGFADPGLVRTHLEACREACRACAEECDRHQEMEHCRRCAGMCRSCERACDAMLETLMSAV